MKNYYRILNIRQNATLDEIKYAYRVLAKKYHPDTNTGFSSNEKFIEIKEAYDKLSNNEERIIYDRLYADLIKEDPSEKNFNELLSKIHQESDAILQEIVSLMRHYKDIPSEKISLEKYHSDIDTINTAFIDVLQRKVISEDIYVQLSSKFVVVAISKSEQIINDIINLLIVSPTENIILFTDKQRLIGVLSWVEKVLNEVFYPIRKLKIDIQTKEYYDFKVRYYEELLTILKSKTDKEDAKGNCYIATHVYGDYNSPNVIILRSFRDVFLKKFLLGRIIVIIYYQLSPRIVTFSKKNSLFNYFIKKLLDYFVSIIRNKF